MKRVLLTILFTVLGAACAAAANFYKVNAGATVDITEHAVCKRVTNNHASGLAIFVPTKTATEWAAFYGTAVPGVTVANCPTGGKWTWTTWCSPIVSNCGGAACPGPYPDNVPCSTIGSTCGGFDSDPSWFYKYTCQ